MLSTLVAVTLTLYPTLLSVVYRVLPEAVAAIADVMYE